MAGFHCGLPRRIPQFRFAFIRVHSRLKFCAALVPATGSTPKAHPDPPEWPPRAFPIRSRRARRGQVTTGASTTELKQRNAFGVGEARFHGGNRGGAPMALIL